jgi:hypothetical protein
VPIWLAALTAQVSALSPFELCKKTVGFDRGAAFCSSTRSCNPRSGHWSKPADLRRIFGADPGIKWCAQCGVSQRLWALFMPVFENVIVCVSSSAQI